MAGVQDIEHAVGEDDGLPDARNDAAKAAAWSRVSTRDDASPSTLMICPAMIRA